MSTAETYRELTTDDLFYLRRAFVLDARRSKSRATDLFCQSRIDLIDEILSERGKRCREYRPDRNGECLACDEPADAHAESALDLPDEKIDAFLARLPTRDKT